MNDRYTKAIPLIAVILAAAASTALLTSSQRVAAFLMPVEDIAGQRKASAPMATSGNNVYVSWWSNKTGNDEVMFKASNDSGKTFGPKVNLSNTPATDSINVEIAAAGSSVYVSWWERNSTNNEPVLRVSNDNGKTFGEKIMLSNK
jgi:hypothetical protein